MLVRDSNMEAEAPRDQVSFRDEPSISLRKFFMLNEYDLGIPSMGPKIGTVYFEIKASVINMLQSFHGLENKDPHKYFDEFLDVYGIVHIHDVDDDALKL